MTDLPGLSTRFGATDRIAFEASPLGGPVVRLTHGPQQVLVALHGAHVLNWTAGGEGLLWLSPVARIKAGKGIRGGIPVCWPWFGDHATDASKPAHGFVRQRAWEVIAATASVDAVVLTLAQATGAADRAAWPHQAEARLTVTLGAGLALALETHNTGQALFPLTQALHTYFRVSDIAKVQVTGLDGRAYLDKLEGFGRKVQAGGIGFERELDRIYLGDTSAIELVDRSAKRTMRIASTGSRSAVVWNPWIEKTARLGDMGSAQAYAQMLCIETANAGDDVVTLAPGARHVLGASYSVVR